MAGQATSRSDAGWLQRAWRGSDKFILFVLAVALLYAALCLSPSSYAVAFQRMGVGKPGLYLGHGRFLRSDEWAMWTPYIQATVNNGFHRINLTSIYGEDLRNFNVLPLKDWGLILKPEMWGFQFLDPAWAFSVFHASLMAAFCIGWYGFFAALGFERRMAALASLLLFYTPYAQCWFTTTGPAIGLFPFIAWAFLSRLSPLIKAPLVAWLTAVWLTGHLYPPIDVSVAFAGAVLILAFRRDALTRWSHLAATLIGGGVGVALVWLYFKDVIPVMAATIYPGQRLNGGGEVSFAQWLAQILPNFASFGEETVAAPNYLEANTSATYLLVFALCFAGWDDLKRLFADPDRKASRLALIVMGAAFLLISAWQLFPLPSWVGAPLLWNRAPGRRFVFANGALLLSMAVVILRAAPPRLTARRFLAAGAVVIASYLLSKGLVSHGQFRRGTDDLEPLIPLLVLWFVRKRAQGAPDRALAYVSLVCGLAMWGFYNPIQSSWPIFHRPHSALAEKLMAEAKENPHGWVVARTISGSMLNGWGLPSVEHALMAPRLTFFHSQFPHLSPDLFNKTFNHFSDVWVDKVPIPLSPTGGESILPVQAFRPAMGTPPDAPLASADYRGGQLDALQVDPGGQSATLTGWAYLSGQGGPSRLSLAGAGVDHVISTAYVARPEAVAQGGDDRLAKAGFVVKVALKPAAAASPLCAWADDPVFGRTWLKDATGAPACDPAAATAPVRTP